MRLKSVIFAFFCIILQSCSCTPKNWPGLSIRYTEWERKTFDYIGLTIELPSQAAVSPSAKGPASLSISMHYVSPPAGILADATVFVNIYVSRITIDQFAEQKTRYLGSGLYERSCESGRELGLWYHDYHQQTSRRDGNGRYSYYRRDIALNEKEMLHINAEVLNAGPEESQEGDHSAVKRIIDSIMPINE